MRTPSGASNPPEATQNTIHPSAGATTPDDDTTMTMTPTADGQASDAPAESDPTSASVQPTEDDTDGSRHDVDSAEATDVTEATTDSDDVADSDDTADIQDATAKSATDDDAHDDATEHSADAHNQPPDHAEIADGAPPPRRRTSRPAWRRPEDENERVARSGTFILTMTLVSALLVSGLLLTLSSVTRLNAGPTQPVTQRQVTPTPTTTVFPTPTAEPGFQFYIDRADGFLVQYPTGWALVSLTPGIDFKDDPNSPSYIVQVLFPGSFSTPGGQGGDVTSGAFWVNYALNGLSTTLSQQGMGVLSRQANCPAPYNHTTTIGGVVWQCGAGYDLVGVTPTPTGAPGATPTTTPNAAPTSTPRPTVGAGPTQTPGATSPASACASGSCLQVVVLATVYHGKPYIISLLTSSDRFEAGNIEFFQPMLESFAFLPQS